MARRRKSNPAAGGFFFLFALIIMGIGGLINLLGPSKPPAAPPQLSSSVIRSDSARSEGARLTYASLPSSSGVDASNNLLAEPSLRPRNTTRAGPSPDEASSLESRQRKIAGRKVPLRTEPEVGSELVDRLNTGQVVTVEEERDGWIRVRVASTQREGWIPAKRLGGEAKANDEPKPRVSPSLTTVVIAKLLIADSLSNYGGSCPCPYHSDRGGRSCGRRSAYSRPGGAAPLCFASDVTSEMVAAYRASH